MSASSRTTSVCTSFTCASEPTPDGGSFERRGHDARRRRASAEGGRPPPPRTRARAAASPSDRADARTPSGVASLRARATRPASACRSPANPSSSPLRTAHRPSASLSHIASTRSSPPFAPARARSAREVRPPARPRLLGTCARTARASEAESGGSRAGYQCFELTRRDAEDVVCLRPCRPRHRGSPRTATFATGRKGVAGSLIGAVAARRTVIRSANGASSSRSGTKLCMQTAARSRTRHGTDCQRVLAATRRAATRTRPRRRGCTQSAP